MKVFTYVLKLGDGKYYVGKTTDINIAIYEHKNRIKSPWCYEHKIVKILLNTPGNYEQALTLLMMIKYGWYNVRGYAWSQRNMIKPPVAIRLMDQINIMNKGEE